MAADAPLFPAALAAAAHAGAAHAAALAAAPDALAAAPDDAPAEAAVNRSAKLKAKPKPKPKPKHAMFSCTFSDHHFELKRSPTTHAKLLHEFVAAGGDATMQPADHAHCVGRFKASTFVFAALAGCQSTRRWSAFFRDEAALEAMRWEVFAICLSTNDPVGLQFLWQGLRADCKEASGPTMPDDVRLELFKNNDPDDDTVVRMLQTAVCACCKPRLGLLLLQQQKRTLSLGARCDLFAMVVAIADAVFGADKTRKTSYIEDHGKWLQVLASAPKPTPECPCVPDKAIDLDAWKQLIRALLLAVGAHGVPNRVVEMLPRDRTYSLGALQVAVRYAEHDTFLLDELLAHKHWSSSALIEAYNEALDASQGVRGPKLCSVLKTLYVELLSEWRRRSPYSGWKSDARDLVFAWKTAVASARGYVEIDVDAHGSVLMASAAAAALWPNDEDESIDPAVWMEILAAMVAAHEPDEWDAHSKHWDHSSALFASLMCAALRACLGDSNKTHILSFLLACEKKTQHAAAMHSCWHDIPGIVSDVAEHHAEAFPMLIKAMLAVDARDARDARDGAPELPKWAPNDKRLFWIIFLFNVVNVVAFAGTASSTGREWYDDAAFPMDTTYKGDLLARDCIGTIYAAFWAGATVAVVRQQWAVFMLPLKAKILWAATVVLLAWMPALQSDVLFNEEWTGYFDSENKYVGRRAQIVVSIANGVVGTTGVLILLQCARRRAKRAKAKIQIAPAAAAAATKKKRRGAVTASSHFSVNFTDAQLLLGDDGAGFTMGPEEPLLFGKARYMPMLGL